MAVTDRQILPLTDPSIAVDPMPMEDYESTENGEKDVNATISTDKATQNEGRNMPRVQINTAILTPQELTHMSMKVSGFLPTIKLVVTDIDDRFANIDFPKDGDVVSLFIRPEDIDNFKEIRIDFDILSIKFVPGDGSTANVFTITGSMKVPNLYAEDCEGFELDTSFNHLNLVADNLSLGFASNEDLTNDAMIRIRPYDTNLKFIKEVTMQAYKDDDSFWTTYIDPFYYLCFVNVNKQFSEADELEDGIYSMSVSPNRSADTNGEDEGKAYTLFLTNEDSASPTNMFINSYGLINNSGNTWIANGYKRYCQYYDIPVEEWTENFVDPLTTEGSESDKILMKGRADETIYENQVKYKYLGKQLGAPEGEEGYNVHENFIFAHILNYQNMAEIEKMAMTVELSMCNFNLYRFQRIPIIIYNRKEDIKRLSEHRNEQTGEQDTDTENPDSIEDGTSQVRNEFLTGYYVISEIEYIYRGNGTPITQKLTCLRREWPIPIENKDY